MKRFFLEFLPPGVLIGGLVMGLIMVGGSVLILNWIHPGAQLGPVNTAQLVILPAPTYTLPLPTIEPTPEPTATSPAAPTPPPVDVQIGQMVQISGTGVDGLRLRAEPGLQGKIMFVAIEAEVFQVLDGPRQADGYIWWYLVSPIQADYKGWGVANYLSLAQQSP